MSTYIGGVRIQGTWPPRREHAQWEWVADHPVAFATIAIAATICLFLLGVAFSVDGQRRMLQAGAGPRVERANTLRDGGGLVPSPARSGPPIMPHTTQRKGR